MSDGSAGTVVLVHGGFVDGSGWQGVYHQLTEDGYSVSVVQNPTISLAGDADATRRVIDAQSEPVILVGHSYGGAVISEAGTDPNVKALVYIAAFMPDVGESVQTLIADLPPETGPPILPPQDGFLLLDRAKFHEAFAGDVDAELAEFMADSQVPWGLEAAGGTISDPAWRSKPSWYLVTTDDRMIPPSLQRKMSERAGATVVETPGSHSIYVSQLRYRLVRSVPAAGGRTGSGRTERRCVFGRLTRFAGVADDGSLELYLELVRDRVLPVVRAIPGFSGYLALSDGERGEVLVLTLWASEQQMRESEEATVQLRSQAADKVGATVLSVERFRVAISELDVTRA